MKIDSCFWLRSKRSRRERVCERNTKISFLKWNLKTIFTHFFRSTLVCLLQPGEPFLFWSCARARTGQFIKPSTCCFFFSSHFLTLIQHWQRPFYIHFFCCCCCCCSSWARARALKLNNFFFACWLTCCPSSALLLSHSLFFFFYSLSTRLILIEMKLMMKRFPVSFSNFFLFHFRFHSSELSFFHWNLFSLSLARPFFFFNISMLLSSSSRSIIGAVCKSGWIRLSAIDSVAFWLFWRQHLTLSLSQASAWTNSRVNTHNFFLISLRAFFFGSDSFFSSTLVFSWRWKEK